MFKLLALLTLFGVSAQLQAATRDFQVICPCAVSLLSDSLAEVSFSIARVYENTNIDSIEVSLVGNNDAFEIIGSEDFGTTTLFNLPPAGEIRSYELLLPLRGVFDDYERTELHFYPKQSGEYQSPYHYRAFESSIPPTRDFGFSYSGSNLAFNSRPLIDMEGTAVSLTIPPVINLADAETLDLSVILGQSNGREFYKLARLPIGILGPSELSESVELQTEYNAEWKNQGYSQLVLYLVAPHEDGSTEDILLKDSLINLDDSSKALENTFHSNAIRLFNDSNSDGISDYNETKLSLSLTDAKNIPTWEINVAVLVSEEATATVSDARVRAEHLFAHTNNIFATSGVAAKLNVTQYLQVGSEEGRLMNDGETTHLEALQEFLTPFQKAKDFHYDNDTDVIMAFVESDETACGVASGSATSDQNLFPREVKRQEFFNYFIVGLDCADSVLAHEFGHISGLGHSRQQREMGVRAFSLGHGVLGDFVTIMPYQSAYNSAVEVELFSNPNLLRCGAGQPCGVNRRDLFSGADAVFTLNQTIPHIAAIKKGYPPIIFLAGPSSLVLPKGSIYHDSAATAWDVEDGDLSKSIVVSGAVDTQVEGLYRISYQVADADGNNINAERTIEIKVDTDGDGLFDDQDIDDDNDGIADGNDAFPLDPLETLDTDQDGVGDNADNDDDGDGVMDSDDAFPLDSRYASDTDTDGLPNNYEAKMGFDYQNPDDALEDFDNDGLDSLAEFFYETHPFDADTDEDGLPDGWEVNDNRNPKIPDYFIRSSSGGYQHCARDDNGIQCWGLGSLPDNLPDQVLDLAVGGGHACLLSLSHHVVCWGYSKSKGQLNVPENLERPTAIAAGDDHTCVLDGGSIKCWGSNEFGQSSTPGFESASRIFAGFNTTCAIYSSTVKCWGALAAELSVAGSDKVKNVAVGKQHACVLHDTDTNTRIVINNNDYRQQYNGKYVTCWGKDSLGSLSDAIDEPFDHLGAGWSFSCGAFRESIKCWGWNYDGTTDPPSITSINQLSVGTTSSCVFTSFGVECWGRDNSGQINTPQMKFDPDLDGYLSEEDKYPLNSQRWTDVDSDEDGLTDDLDALPLDPAETLDTDGDGTGNNADLDDDGDGYSDAYELETGTDPLDATDFKPPYDDLNGVVYHWSQHSLVTGAEIIRVSNVEAKSVTDSQGLYTFEETPEGNYELSASQAVTDVDTNRTITSADALAALKIAVGLNPNSDPDGDGPLEALAVSPYQLIAADMNQDGRVTSADALAILKVAVGLSDALEPSWKLVEASQALWSTHSDKSRVFNASQSYALSYPDQTQANFAAILLGDVNASWKPQEGTESLNHDHFSAYAKVAGAPLSLWGIRDSDQDGLSDEQEDALGTSPFDADTDADGVNDIDDAYPLDPDKSEDVAAGLHADRVLSASPKRNDLNPVTLVNPVLLRGDMNDWGVGDVFTKLEDGSYYLALNLEAGTYTFKIATKDWAMMDLGADDEASRLIVLNKFVTLSADSNASFVLEVNDRSELVFVVEHDSDGTAVLSVSELQ